MKRVLGDIVLFASYTSLSLIVLCASGAIIVGLFRFAFRMTDNYVMAFFIVVFAAVSVSFGASATMHYREIE